jgi:two-component sensor histidine kinase
MVLVELVQNAVEHGRPSEVVIETERRSDWLRVHVRDDGQGLPAGFQVAANTRLGLQIVRTLVETELGGELTLGPAEGGGTVATAVLRLPSNTQM